MRFPCTTLILKLGFNNVTSGGDNIYVAAFLQHVCLLLDLHICTYHAALISGKIWTIIMSCFSREKGQGVTHAQLARRCSPGCPIVRGGGSQETVQVNTNARRHAVAGLHTWPKSCISFSGS